MSDWARLIPDALAEDLTDVDIEHSLLASGMTDDDIEAVREDAPLITTPNQEA